MEDSDDKGGKRVQAVSREPRFSKLRAMKCFEEVHKCVVEGHGPTELARMIQEDRGEYTDAERITLINVLKEYRASIPPAELVNKRLPEEFNKAAAKLYKGVDEVKELEWLAKFQKRRLKIDGETEKKINKLLPTMTQEVRAHAEVLRSLADVKMDLGVSKRHLGEMTVDANLVAEVTGRYGKASIAKVLQSAESRQKLMGVAEKFLALAARDASGEDEEDIIDVTPEPTEPQPPTKAEDGAEPEEVIASDSTKKSDSP